MNLLLINGDWQDKGEYLARLVAAGYTLTSSGHAWEGVGEAAALRPAGLVSALDGEADVERAAAAQEIGLPWLAWDCGGDAALAALRSGAVVVLPPDASPADLEQAAANSFPWQDDSVPSGEGRTYLAGDGETIPVGEDSIVDVQRGIVAMRLLQPDGGEVLIGLFGPGEAWASCSTHHCHIDLVACCVGAEVSIMARDDLPPTVETVEKLRRSLLNLSVWTAIQLRPQADQRVLGILSLIAERFGTPRNGGWDLIDLRLTHQRLADASGLSRPAVSRSLQALEEAGDIRMEGRGGYRRIFVRNDATHWDADRDGE